MWISFQDSQPERNSAVLVWCAQGRLVSLVEDFRSEDASNNWLLWMPCPSPTAGEIELADRQEEASVLVGGT
jgi:hypothetical protein